MRSINILPEARARRSNQFGSRAERRVDCIGFRDVPRNGTGALDNPASEMFSTWCDSLVALSSHTVASSTTTLRWAARLTPVRDGSQGRDLAVAGAYLPGLLTERGLHRLDVAGLPARERAGKNLASRRPPMLLVVSVARRNLEQPDSLRFVES